MTATGYGVTTVIMDDTTYNISVLSKYDSTILKRNAKADSERKTLGWNTDGPASYAFNGDSTNWWHTHYSDEQYPEDLVDGNKNGQATTDNPISIWTGFEKVWSVKEIHYTPRTTGATGGKGVAKDYKVYVANLANPLAEPTTDDWGTPVKTGTLNNTYDKQVITLNDFVYATHVRLEVTSTYASDGHITASNISIYGMNATNVVKQIGGIKVTTLPKQLYLVGQSFDKAGIGISYVYNTGEIEAITVDENDIQVSAVTTDEAGTFDVTATYQGFSDVFEIQVIEDGSNYPNEFLTVSACSEASQEGNGNGYISCAFDGKTGTYWHSNYANNRPTDDKIYVQMVFESATVVDAVKYLSRQGSGGPFNGTIYKYRIEGTTDENITESTEWCELTSDEWTIDASNYTEWQIAEFPARELTAIRLVAVTSKGGFGNAAEINVRVADANDELMADSTSKGRNLALEGKIDLNFFVKLTDVAGKSGAKVRLDVAKANGTTASSEVAVKSAEKRNDSNGNYSAHVFTVSTAAKEMTEDITATLCYVDGEEQIATSSVKDYADSVLAQETDATYTDDLKNLLKAMLNYGAASQIQFGYNTGKLANAGINYPVPVTGISGYGFNEPGSITGLTYYGSSLILESETTLCHYFKLAEDARVDSYNAAFTDGTTNAVSVDEVTAAGGERLLRVKIKNIVAKDLNKVFDLVVTTGADESAETLTVSYAPLTYAQKVLAGNQSDTLKDLAKALKDYSDKADIYFN